MPLTSYINEFTPAIEEQIIAIIAQGNNVGSDYYRMMAYHLGFDDDAPPSVRGKRTRPVIVLLCAAAAGANWRDALPFAAAVELIHNFSLVHDDIQDDSDMRRGRPTLWKLWGMPQAINSGDALFAQAYAAICCGVNSLPPDVALVGMSLLTRTSVALTKGQERDMHFETRDSVTVDEYLAMIEGKTASLIDTAARLGAVAAQAPAEVIDRYGAFGRHLGLAFQMRDDILGIWGDSAKTGKSTATDVATRKMSMPILRALAQSPDLAQRYGQRGNGSAAETAELVALIEQTDARSFTEEHERYHADKAINALKSLGSDDNAPLNALRELTHGLLGRAM